VSTEIADPQTRVARSTAAANRLWEASRTGTPCAPVRDLIGTDDVRAAYGTQQRNTTRRLIDGAEVVGRKIGLTSESVQHQLGVDQPDFGVLFDDMQRRQDVLIAMDGLIQPRIEAEIAFVLAADLDDTDATAASVRGAVAYAVPALEIVDSRIAAWDITLADTIADNASSGLFVLGANQAALDRFEPVTSRMSMSVNGVEASTGTGTACLGDPLNALAWLARTAAQMGDPLLKGQVILSGALGPMVPVAPGDVVTASITGLGKVQALFAPATHREAGR